ncbi:helix-turn-helix domain-containing protein [Erwinia psidii]|uniref:Helix-turn-helix domain-containing protein n=1 Tax=Erwinia psidii TaxID=69224 RepID=A0A3N6RV25_9GAMM|nr:helix-turn-helix domain-containing protein [Erwinia psidii]MCX8958996.1 helix-turn-helix domain-containing protein [Erwinia psidii]MCX8962804.1 helix-turn-helix domain-containing protein [Erwinia psidii]MCX8966122.1 helix-turn-helix domain-containing protein [Erwinia psidii]RQM36774.1 helix-turn-helix domain-containing protein [Erwinia psidii]
MTITLPRETHFRHPDEKVVFHFWQPEKSLCVEHRHEYCELFLVEKGSGIHIINEKPYLLTAGTLCYLNRHDYHLFEEMKNLKQVNLLYLAPDKFNILKNIEHLLIRPEESNVWQINTHIMQKIINKLLSHSAMQYENKLLCESHKEMIFLEALHVLNQWRYKTQDFSSSDDRISQIIIWLNTHLAEPLDLDRLCRDFSISRRTLQRGFTDYTGVSPQKYLTTMRLLQAKYHLQYSNMTVSEAGKYVGLSEASYFSRLFRKQFGISPGQCL